MNDHKGITHKIRVRNLSATGLGGVIDHPLAIDECVQIDLPSMNSIMAVVTRVAGKEFGVRFQASVEPERVSVKIENKGSTFALRDLHKTVHDHRRPGLGNR